MAIIPVSIQVPSHLFDQLLHYGKNVDGRQRPLCEENTDPRETRWHGSVGYNAEQMIRDSGKLEQL
jgi:hypothetical protein